MATTKRTLKKSTKLDSDVKKVNYDETIEYRCLRCGKTYNKPVGHFYMSQWSELYTKNSNYAPWCKDCVNEMFDKYENKYGTQQACIFMCYKLDVPFSFAIYDSIVTNSVKFTMGLYLRQVSNLSQTRFQDFTQTLLADALLVSKESFDKEKETKWSKQDNRNKNYAIDVIGYDPFEDYPEDARKYLFNQLMPYLEADDEISDDPYKLSQILQIVDNNNQIRQYDRRIAKLDPIRDCDVIKSLNGLKKDLVSSNDKIAKENEISVKNRSDKDVGRSTLTYLMRDLREKDFDKAEADYYDQLRSEGTLWANYISQKALLEHCIFDENDKKEIYETQLNLIDNLNKQLDDAQEKIRLLNLELDKRNIVVKGLTDGGGL